MAGSPPGTGTTPGLPYSIGSLEGALVAFLGAFFSALGGAALVGIPSTPMFVTALIAGGGAFATFLGYHSYQTS